ncbi:MAG: EFR1 family ferrodoxin, partial [Candidatus Methanomethylophilaceae archaeon]|nr:EFR1 family ferrodoxin [Candidatus Methanomethylophilaceae archaeon]
MLFVFSATGNSYDVAKRISDALDMKMVDTVKAVRHENYTFDAKGEDSIFVFPVYYATLPSIVRRFAANLRIIHPGKVRCVITCAGDSGVAGEALQKELGNVRVDSMFDVCMPDNAVFYEEPPDKEECTRILDAAHREVEEVIAHLRSGDVGDFRR